MGNDVYIVRLRYMGTLQFSLKTVLRNLGIVAYTFKLSTPEMEVGISLSLKSAWSTQLVAEQPGQVGS